MGFTRFQIVYLGISNTAMQGIWKFGEVILHYYIIFCQVKIHINELTKK